MPRFRRLAAAVVLVLALNIVIAAALAAISSPGTETTWSHTSQFLRAVQGADSWKPMEIARDYLHAHSNDLYEEVFFTRHVKFQYPETALLFVGHASRRLLNAVSWLATLLTAAVSAVILYRSERRTLGLRTAAEPAVLVLAFYAATVALALTFYPLVKGYSLGQIQTWLDAGFAVLVLCWMDGRRVIAGILLGLICLIKPTFVPLLGWALVRREWTMLVATISTVAAGVAAAAWIFGGINARGYLQVLSYIGSRGEAYYPNQSFNGLVNRFVGNGSNLEWSYFDFPPVHPVVVATTMAALVVLGALAWLAPPRTSGRSGAVDLCITALTATMTAPVAWEHHYGIMLPMYAAVTPPLLTHRPLGSWTVPALVGSFVVAANFLPQTNRFAATPFNPVQSYLLGAALVLLALMYAVIKGPAARVRPKA